MTRDDWVLVCLWLFAFLVGLVGQSGCVRSVTVCTTFDHSLGRADPNSGLPRNNAGASVCTEMGPSQ
jgi:hypothetical protein